MSSALARLEEVGESEDSPIPDPVRLAGDFRHQPRVEEGLHPDAVPDTELEPDGHVPPGEDALPNDHVGHRERVRAPRSEGREVEAEDSVDFIAALQFPRLPT